MLKLHPFSAETSIEVMSNAPHFGTDLNQRIQDIWDAEQVNRGGLLFDGQLFSVDHVSESQIIGRFVPYRSLIAQRVDPSLFEALRVRPLAVSGLLRCASGIVFGLRGDGLTQDGSMWELAPSGGVDGDSVNGDGDVDLIRQIGVELSEELGLSMSQMTDMHPFCLIEDTDSHVFDVGLELCTDLDEDDVRAAYENKASDEYEALNFVREDEVADFINRQVQDVLSVSRLLLQTRGLL